MKETSAHTLAMIEIIRKGLTSEPARTLQDLADEFRVSRQYVHQLAMKAGIEWGNQYRDPRRVTAAQLKRQQRAERKALRERRKQRALELMEKFGYSAVRAANEVGLSATTVYSLRVAHSIKPPLKRLTKLEDQKDLARKLIKTGMSLQGVLRKVDLSYQTIWRLSREMAKEAALVGGQHEK